MRRSLAWRALLSLGMAGSLAAYAQVGAIPTSAAGGGLSSQVHQGGLSAADVQRLSQNANQKVIVILRDQHTNLPARGASSANRQAAIASDQAAIVGELAQVHAPGVRAYSLINAVAATVSAAEANHLRANTQVQAVVPDLTIHAPVVPREAGATASAASKALASAPAVTGGCNKNNPALAPEALQLIHAASANPANPSAQQIVTGTGVTVAWIADGIDPNNPDFIRSDGSHVFTDYQDFSGDGPSALTDGAEAFGDASSIAAQGNVTFDIRNFESAQPVPGCPYIHVVGVAPGASLMGLKVFGQNNTTTTSNFVQAIQYAVTHGANVINESFGGNPYPDNANDPISIADDAAVNAGVTVVASTGDAGTAGTLGSPATDPNVIAAGASTQFKSYQQTAFGGFPLGATGYLSDNISSLSSAGTAQSGQQTVDVVAPGDLGWADCSDSGNFFGCTDDNFNFNNLQLFGGTSEASPLTAGEAALVIEAYRNTHGGVTPAPALVKEIIKSTASNMGLPGYEQGAGLINALRAVQAAASLHDANGSPAAQGDALLVSPSTLAATAAPNTPESFAVQVTNTGAQAQSVHLGLQQLGGTTWSASYVVNLDPTTDPSFIDSFGRARAYVEQDFTVPAGAQRLDAAISFDTTNANNATSSPTRVTLIDPQGRLAAYSLPQDPGAPFPDSGYGHVDVRFPVSGIWKAFIWTRANATGYSGPVHLDVSTSNNQWIGSASPAQTLQPGQTGTFTVSTHTPVAPGDLSAKVVVDATDLSTNVRHSDGAIPVILRSLVALGPSGGSFSGTLTGGNGRAFSPGQTLTYQFDVPAGLKDLDLGFSLGNNDSNYNLEGVLVGPDGLLSDVQSTVTALDPHTGLPTAYASTMQFFRHDPAAGRWKLVLFINDNISGAQTSVPFTVNIQFNHVLVTAPGLPNDPSVTLAQGVPVTVQLNIVNTGNTTKDFFVDPRLAQSVVLPLGGYTQTVPLPAGQFTPQFLVPPASSEFDVVAESSPTVPINMDVFTLDGASPFGGTNAPDLYATQFVDPANGNQGASVTLNAAEVPMGFWAASPSQVGPYSDPGATPVTVQVSAQVVTQQFDTAVSSDTGDAWGTLLGQTSGGYSPATLTPGALGKVNVVITPNAAPGTVVHGLLYVDTLATSNGFLTTGTSDELAAIPYTYTVGK